MNAVFADSFYFFALLNPRDHAHQRASRFARAFEGITVSTAWVFTEVGDGLSAPRDRDAFGLLFDRFSVDPLCRLLGPSPDLFAEGIDLYRARPDKSWPLTDCISFVVMQREGLTEALTADRHFTQAGFRAMLANAD